VIRGLGNLVRDVRSFERRCREGRVGEVAGAELDFVGQAMTFARAVDRDDAVAALEEDVRERNAYRSGAENDVRAHGFSFRGYYGLGINSVKLLSAVRRVFVS